MKKFFVVAIFVLTAILAKAAYNWQIVLSPDSNLQFIFDYSDEFVYTVERGNSTIISSSSLGIVLGGTTSVTLTNGVLLSSKIDSYEGKIQTHLGERSEWNDEYNNANFRFTNDYIDTFEIEIRVYNEGFAFRYVIENEENITLSSDNSTINFSGLDLTFYSESGYETGYTQRSSTSSFSTLTPMFAYNDTIAVTVNEAANTMFSKAKISVSNSVVSFSQSSGTITSDLITPWRYVVVADNPNEMIEGKYIMYSLNVDEGLDDSWIIPGKVFRSLEGSTYFYTDSVKASIDFASLMNFEYVLLDAGWYGLGYSYESSADSNPFETVEDLDIETAVDYADENNVGLILYVNNTAWNNYDNDAIFDTYSAWGVKGIKMGYMQYTTASGMKKFYANVERAYDHEMFLNIHDAVRPTGVERTWPNLLTTEGIRGNENFPSSEHNMLLPYTRFMTGAADYTICYAGYPTDQIASKVAAMTQTKGHQMALSVIYFSPLQHVLWYGKHWWYETLPDEIAFFRDLVTVWDDFEVLAGAPGSHFAIARRSDDKWFVAAATVDERNLSLPLDFLSATDYSATVYEDDGNSGVKISTIKDISSASTLDFPLLAGGCGYYKTGRTRLKQDGRSLN